MTETVLAELIEHARRDAPLEACGYLGGKDGIITVCYPMKNIDSSGEHFSLDPEEQFSVFRDIRKNNKTLAAVYHSHPDSPARPSVEDIRLAYDPDIHYVIVSLMGGVESVNSFLIKDSVVKPEGIEVFDHTMA